MTSREKRLVALLKSIEFIETDRGVECPSCGEGHYKDPDKATHAATCALAALIKECDEPPMIAYACPNWALDDRRHGTAVGRGGTVAIEGASCNRCNEPVVRIAAADLRSTVAALRAPLGPSGRAFGFLEGYEQALRDWVDK